MADDPPHYRGLTFAHAMGKRSLAQQLHEIATPQEGCLPADPAIVFEKGRLADVRPAIRPVHAPMGGTLVPDGATFRLHRAGYGIRLRIFQRLEVQDAAAWRRSATGIGQASCPASRKAISTCSMSRASLHQATSGIRERGC